MKKILLLFAVFYFLCKMSDAQIPDWLWAKSAQGTDNDDATSVTTDGYGNVFVAGWFASPTITFGSFTLTNAGPDKSDMFIVKYDYLGNVIWAKNAGGTQNDNATSITTDGNRNIIVAGFFESSTITFGSFTLTNTSSNMSDMFIVKYDNLGNVLWAKSGGGSSGDGGYSVTADGNGNIIMVGHFSSLITFDSFTLSSNGNFDMFIVKYDNTGNVIWAKSAGGTEYEIASSVTTDENGNIFVVGSFASSTINIDSFALINAGSGEYDIFMVKYDNTGSVIWAYSSGGTNSDDATSVTSDGSGNIIMVGSFTSPFITFGSDTLTNAGGSDMFIVKFDSSSNVIWTYRAGGTTNIDEASSVTTDSYGNIYVAGYYESSTITFGSFTFTNAGNCDIFLVKYDNSGNVLWAKSPVGTEYDIASSITADGSGDIFMAGFFANSTLTFGLFTLTNTGNDNNDVFLVRLSSSNGIESSMTQNSISVFPNPATDNITVIIPQKVTIEILNINGQIIKTMILDSGKTAVDIGDLSNGIYIIKAKTDKGVLIKKFIKE
jgi:hypothetical protein